MSLADYRGANAVHMYVISASSDGVWVDGRDFFQNMVDFRVCGELYIQDSWILFGCCVPFILTKALDSRGGYKYGADRT